ncbi:DotU family type IV/VI secretion system protein [Arsenophonus sp. aPb]|uniref:DotU family type IV/VI secretion system protein n=1 Tax=Arsenophonus sp. aPb TaxID=3041619 RepID=UPI002468C862|nr:DotU family type IV/VI secretion system protein [Arsenophonus sp. aPb]WGL98707.1 DotU family type IV/VI secretion system protein [Arsenophonus sp. aPb]
MYLVDFYRPVFHRVLLIVQQTEQYSDTLRETVKTMLVKAQENALMQGYDKQDIDDAHFAVLVWVDEMILNAGAQWLEQWRLSSLQQLSYDSTLGGLTFFERLKSMSIDRFQARLVYLCCLLCGFRGRYATDGEIALHHLIDQEIDNLPNHLRQFMTNKDLSLMPILFNYSDNHAQPIMSKGWERCLAISIILALYLLASVCLFNLAT